MPTVTNRNKAEEKIRDWESYWSGLADRLAESGEEALDDLPPVADQLHDHLLVAQAHGLLAIRQAIRELDETLRYLAKQQAKSGQESDFILLKMQGVENGCLYPKSAIKWAAWNDDNSCLVKLHDNTEPDVIENGNLVQFASELGAF
jgi:hypothetical protein